MKWICLSLILLPLLTYADAGFNIQRPKATCFAVFKGIDKLTDFEFIKVSINDLRRNQDREDTLNRLKENDSFKIYYTEGRRYWEGPIKVLIRNKTTHQYVDSFTLIAEGYNLAINFTGIENNKPKYTIDKTKSEYAYSLYGSENVDAATAKRNKYILIAMSVSAFLILFFMLYKRRNKAANNPE